MDPVDLWSTRKPTGAPVERSLSRNAGGVKFEYPIQ